MRLRDLFGRREAPTPAPASDGDRLVIEQLRKAGADLSRPREVLHYLYLPTEEGARAAAAALRREGYGAEIKPSADADKGPPNPWLVLARAETVVDAATIALARSRFESLAAEHGGDYDGWEAALY